MDGGSKKMAALRAKCLECRACGLSEGRRNVVFGVGREDAEVLFIGEGPGEREDALGEPFVGRSGMLLDDMLAMIGLDRSKIYIANIVKCRPPGNRDPSTEEQDACIGWLRNQTALISPKLIVCLGRIAAKRIIKPNFLITSEHGEWFPKGRFQLMATYHPSALLRDVSKRPEAFEDFESLRLKIGECCVDTVLD
jgi:DNA polymerase